MEFQISREDLTMRTVKSGSINYSPYIDWGKCEQKAHQVELLDELYEYYEEKQKKNNKF